MNRIFEIRVLLCGLLLLSSLWSNPTDVWAVTRVKLHVRVAPSVDLARGTSLLGRQVREQRDLEGDIGGLGGTVEPFLRVDRALERRLERSTPSVYESLERLTRWYVVELDAADAISWRSTALGRSGVERIEIPTPIEEARAIEINDPEFPLEQAWMFELIDVEPAWNEVRAEDGDVVAAVVDGGFDVEHLELQPNLWVNPGEIPDNDVDDDGNGYVDDVHGFNETTRDGDVLYLPGRPDLRQHGTLVAGMLGAVADNGIDGAGVAYNPRLMLVSVQDESGEGLDTTYAYRGITYAALNGASVINCSWRGIWFSRPGSENRDSAPFREFENDVVEAATALGALVVAAAGNDARTDLVPSPSHYPSVLSVTATNDRSNPWQLWQNSNAGPWVDLAAPGDRLFGIMPDEETARFSGTSLSAPIVSAAAVLVKTKWPDWSPDQIRARLRSTARDIDDSEPIVERRGGAGRGMVQFGAAITAPQVPAIAIRDVRFVADDGSEIFGPGDDVAVAFEARSLFPANGPVLIRLEADDPFVVPFETTLFLSGLAEGSTLSVRRGLELKVRETTPPGHIALVHLIIEAGDEIDRQSFYVDALPYQVEARSAELELSVAPTGKLGYSEYNRPLATSGIGFRRVGESVSSLFFGSFVVGTGPGQMIDAVQSFLPLTPREDFVPRNDGGSAPVTVSTDAQGWTTTRLRMASASRTDGLALEVEQRVLAHDDPARGDFLISHWRVTPVVVDAIAARDSPVSAWAGAHAGVLMDWAASGAGEIVRTDPSSGTQWAEPADGAADDGRVVGARVLTHDAPLRAAHFDAVGPREGGAAAYMIDLRDLGRSMPDSMLWGVLSPSAADAAPREGNVVGMIGAGPYPAVRAGTSFEFAVALTIADTKDAAFDALDRAEIAWGSLREGGNGLPVARLQMLPNVPNPFNPRTTLRFALPRRGPVSIDVYDVRGRRVHRLVDEVRDAGYHRVDWDGRDATGDEVASGVYFVRVRHLGADASRPIVLVR